MVEYSELEYEHDEIYYWLVFTVFFGSMCVAGACLFVLTYKCMVCMRKKRIENKAKSEFALNAIGSKLKDTGIEIGTDDGAQT